MGMEFVSLGGLLPGLSPDDIKSGISQPRNHNLANMFQRLNYIESYGTGIRRILTLYADCHHKPEIEITANTFKIILPNMNSANPVVKEAEEIKPQWQTVIDHLKAHGELTEQGLMKLLGLKKTRAYTLSKQMEEAGVIEIIGRGDNKKYKLK